MNNQPTVVTTVVKTLVIATALKLFMVDEWLLVVAVRALIPFDTLAVSEEATVSTVANIRLGCAYGFTSSYVKAGTCKLVVY